MDTTSHIAGPLTTIDRRMVQRCSYCGEILVTYDLSRVMVANKPDGSPGDPPRGWADGAIVRVTEGNPRLTETIEIENGELPADSCFHSTEFED